VVLRVGVVGALALVVLATASFPVHAQQRKVISIHAARRDAPAPIVADETIRRVLQQQLAEKLDYYAEYVDVTRFPDAGYLPALRDYLRYKYASQRFDVVVATSDAALDFVKNFGDEIFPAAAVVFVAETGTKPPSRGTGVTFSLDLSRTLGLVARLEPDVRRIVVVSGASESDRFYEDLGRRQFQPYDGRFEFTYWSGLTMADLLARGSELPGDAVLYPVGLFEDGAGERFVALDALDRLAAASSRPVYAWALTEMNHGVIGGDMIDLERIYTEAARLALRVVAGEPAETIPVTSIDPYVVQVDWRQLQRWGVSESRVPGGGVVRFREPSLWSQYRGLVMAAASLLVLQSALIAGLLVQRARRRRAEQQNRDLVGRLITAQESERTRIARELHDDVGQRVASLSMEIGLVRRRVGDGPPGVRDDLNALQQDVIVLAKDLRELSHELHPGLLEHLGLADALKARCDEVSAESGVAVRLAVGADIGTIPPEVSLCVYRVAQEALRNVVKHAKAETAQIDLTRNNGRLAMRIADDGRGFDGPPRGSRGLGLISLDERVRSLNGTFRVDSAPGHGTTVSVSLPVGDFDGTTTSINRR
jgi:signal transduction histidine kinase